MQQPDCYSNEEFGAMKHEWELLRMYVERERQGRAAVVKMESMSEREQTVARLDRIRYE